MKFRIAELRKSKQMSQGSLSEAAHVSRATISGLESGRITTTTSGTLEKIARALNTTVSQLFFAE